jgi:F-type H+-transporting ATPase subunit b
MSAEFWVGTGFFIFIGILGWFGVHKTLIKGLDARGERVSAELAEAKRLRVEAENLLADYEARRLLAEQEAASVVADAKAEAERISAAAKLSVEDFITRCTAKAELKIAQAEANATSEVKAAAADAAVRAAETILRDQMAGKTGADIFAAGLADVKAKLN